MVAFLILHASVLGLDAIFSFQSSTFGRSGTRVFYEATTYGRELETRIPGMIGYCTLGRTALCRLCRCFDPYGEHFTNDAERKPCDVDLWEADRVELPSILAGSTLARRPLRPWIGARVVVAHSARPATLCLG